MSFVVAYTFAIAFIASAAGWGWGCARSLRVLAEGGATLFANETVLLLDLSGVQLLAE